MHTWKFFIIYLFICPETTIIRVIKVPVHELDNKTNKLALTIAHKHNKLLHTVIYNTVHQNSINQSVSHLN